MGRPWQPCDARGRRGGAARSALALGALALVLAGVVVLLTLLTGDPLPANDGLLLVALGTACGVGTLVAWRQPRNPVGWLLIAVTLLAASQTIAELYVVLDYRQHGGDLPL